MRKICLISLFLLSGCTFGSAIQGNNVDNQDFVDLHEVPNRDEASAPRSYHQDNEKIERVRDLNQLKSDVQQAKEREQRLRLARPK